MVLTGVDLRKVEPAGPCVQPYLCLLLLLLVCPRCLYDTKVFCKTEKRKELVQQFQERVAVRGPSQRGGWEEHAHSHFSWCVRKISAMTQRPRDLRWRRFRAVSGVYFSTWRNQRERQERTDEGVFGCLARSRCKSA